MAHSRAMDAFTLTGARVYAPRFLAGADTIVVVRGVIAEIGRIGDVEPRGPVVDLGGLTVGPGFVDLQLNGAVGVDVMAADPAALRHLAAQLPRFGCTGFLPTVITAERSRLVRALRAIAEATTAEPTESLRHGQPSARILGAHLEGPYLSADFAGAHDLTQIRPFNWTEWTELAQAARGTIRLVTLAPEVPANRSAIAKLATDGVVVSAGHSGATYSETIAAAGAGLRMMTHVFNAMRGLHHREPGPIGAAFDNADLAVSVIADGIHVHPAVLRLVRRLKDAAGVIAVTDAAWMTGLPPGDYPWEGRIVRYDGHAPYLEGGVLAGSGLTMDVAVANLVRLGGFSLDDAFRAAAANPARMLRLVSGGLRPGAPADLVVLDHALGVSATYVGGVLAYRHSDSPIPEFQTS